MSWVRGVRGEAVSTAPERICPSSWAARSVGAEAPVVVPTSGEGAQTVDARPAGEETEADVAEPEPEVVNGSAPTPVAERPQEEGAAEEAPVDATAGEEGATPVPSPAPVPRSAPLEGPEPALITVEGSLLVEFREGPRRHRAGWVPPGTWQIYADFGTGGLTRAGSLYAEPGGRMVVRCCKLRRECVVD